MKAIVTLVALMVGIMAQATTHYVDLNSPSPTPPYDSWGTAATNIQDAVDVAVGGDTVLVADGHYLLTSTIEVNAEINICSVNGAEATIIDGQDIVQCIYLGMSCGHCSIDGFTITRGVGRDRNVVMLPAPTGGGAYSRSLDTTIKNCIFKNCWAHYGGGGNYGSTLYNCTFIGNTAGYVGGGNGWGVLYNCTFSNNTAYIGGGSAVATLHNCVLIGNTADFGGGSAWDNLYNCTIKGNTSTYVGGGCYAGAWHGTDIVGMIYNCTLSDNTAAYAGGGSFQNTLYNCMLKGNTAGYAGGGSGRSILYNSTLVGNTADYAGGSIESTLINCIVYYNNATVSEDNWYGDSFTNSCTLTFPTNGIGNITNAPLFVDPENGDYRLLATSPCIDAGDNSYVTTTNDLAGSARIVDGDFDGTATVDMGAYEFNSIIIPSDSNSLPPINLKSNGRIPVTIRSTDDFDASSIDPYSVRFAGAAPVKYVQHATDLKLFFNTADLEINPEDTTAVLIGQTDTGRLVVSVVPIQLVP